MHDILARRWPAAELFHLEIEMLVLPWRQRLGHRPLKGIEPDDGPSPLVESSSDRGFSPVEMSMTADVVAFAIERRVLFCRKFFAVQTVGRAERCLQAEQKKIPVPVLRKKIRALVQPDSFRPDALGCAPINMAGEGFGCDWLLGQSRNLAVQVLVVELGAEQFEAIRDLCRQDLGFSKRQARAV